MPVIDRATASLQLRGDSLEPHIVTEMLGAAPTFAYTRGDRIPAGHSSRIARYGLWSLEAPAAIPAALDVQVAQLLDRLTRDLTVWHELSTRYDVFLFCGWFLRGRNEGLVITPETLGSLAERGIALDVDIYAT